MKKTDSVNIKHIHIGGVFLSHEQWKVKVHQGTLVLKVNETILTWLWEKDTLRLNLWNYMNRGDIQVHQNRLNDLVMKDSACVVVN